jgi:GT2 family glycosyltransferase
MKVSVIIPHYNDFRGLNRCLDALRRQTFPASDMEIIVADNASPQGEAAVAEVIGNRARLVTVAKKGAGPARNGGFAVSKGDVVAFIDSDCVPEPHWLEKGAAALADCDIAGGRVDVLVEDTSHVTAAEAFERVFAFDIERYVKKKGFVPSGNMFCPRGVFEAVGGFDVGVSEDVEWSHRATGKGFRIAFVPEAAVGHPARRTWSELTRKGARVNAERYALALRERGGRIKWGLVCLALPFSSLVHTPKVLFSSKLKGIGQRLEVLAMLYGLRCWRALDSVRLLVQGAPAPASPGHRQPLSR